MEVLLTAKATGGVPALTGAFPSLPTALAAFAKWRDSNDVAGSTFKGATVKSVGKLIGHLSYNGRVWAKPSREWTPDTKPLFNADGSAA